MFKSLAGTLARSPLFKRGRELYALNKKDWNHQLTKPGKLQLGLYLILEDYSKGLFPPPFKDQQVAFAGEIAYRTATAGTTAEQVSEGELRKPFWNANSVRKYLEDYCRLVENLELAQLRAPARLLELGCGSGWMAEMLAMGGYEVTGTSIAPDDIADARKRVDSLSAKGLKRSLRFEIAPMESVAEMVGPAGFYDGVFVFEALHHAFDWRQALDSGLKCLKPGGVLLICNEPNLVHTFSSYRVARFSNTHEIGFSRAELMRHLRGSAACASVDYLSTPWHFWCRHHWILARKKS